MHEDARSFEMNSIIEGDICIVGAGAAGISIALEWINSPYKVILLEGGGFEYDEEVQDLYDGNTTGQKYFPLKSSRVHCFGGTTLMWAGMCSPFDPIDFTKRDWVPDSGWPITKEDLNPYYKRAQRKVFLGNHEYDLEYWQKELPEMNPFPLDKNVVWNKMWQHSRMDFGYSKKKLIGAENIHLITYANVTDIKANESIKSIEKLVAKNHAGKTFEVKAKHFILACGAIQNARLLLASNSQIKEGVGNANDVVGRYFMEHIENVSSELRISKPFSTSLYDIDHRLTRANAELAITENEQRKHRILNGTASLFSLKVGRHMKPRIETWQHKDPRKAAEITFGHWTEAEKKAKEENDENFTNSFQLISRMEQAPNPNSRITIGREKDALGMPRASLHWELGGLEKRSIRKLHQLIGEQVEISGLGHVELMDFLKDENDVTFPKNTTPGWHHMGTTRMNSDPKKGVVDANCQVHNISNLFIAGSSCFPTSGAPNPTLTLIALTIRLSDYLKKII